MPTYSADQIVGKTLVAKKKVAIHRLPSKDSPVVYQVNPGITVGVVYSWVQGSNGIWWMYYDSNNKPYYTLHEPGMYDIKTLTAQGVESLEQIQEAEKKAEDPIGYYLTKLLKPAVFAVVGYFGIKAILDISESQTRRRK